MFAPSHATVLRTSSTGAIPTNCDSRSKHRRTRPMTAPSGSSLHLPSRVRRPVEAPSTQHWYLPEQPASSQRSMEGASSVACLPHGLLTDAMPLNDVSCCAFRLVEGVCSVTTPTYGVHHRMSTTGTPSGAHNPGSWYSIPFVPVHVNGEPALLLHHLRRPCPCLP